MVQGSNPTAENVSLRNFGNSVYPALPVSFGGDTKSRRSLLSGVYARGSKRSHQSALECVTVVDYIAHSNTPFTLALLIRSETGFAPMRAFTLHQLIRISDWNRIKLNHLLEVVSHRFSLLRVLIASVDATRTRTKAEQI